MCLPSHSGCADGVEETTYEGHGTVTLTADTGIDFTTGIFQSKGNYATSDIYVTSGGEHLMLASGGLNPTKNRPVDFFLGAGGIHETFDTLSQVPAIPPSADKTQSLIKAKTGNGFVVENSDGSITRGWIRSAGDAGLVIDYDRVP